MKKLSTILLILLSITINTQAQFSVVQTKLIENPGYSNLFTSFLEPASDAIYKSFPSSYGVLAAQENIVDARVQNGALVEGRAMVAPLTEGDVLTSNISFYTLFRDSNVENCQVILSIKLLYELRNDGAVSADLHYGLNPKIQFVKNGSFAGSSGHYSVQLRESTQLGGQGALIHNSFNMTAGLNNNFRGVAYTNVPAGETRYVLLEVWVEAYSEFGLGTIFMVDASQGLSVGFDNEAIAINHGLDNDPFIDVKAKLKFQLHNLFANTNTGPAMGNTGAFAFINMDWENDISNAYATAENTGLLNNVDGITVTMDGFDLVDFDPMPETNPGFGSAGDRRTYINGVAKIYKDSVLKMQIDECRIALNIDYPAPIGSGSEATGGGWGRISTVNTDPAWFTEFDENNTQQVEFVFHSFSTVVNNPYYDAVIAIIPAEYRDEYVGWQVGAAGGIVDGTDSVGIRMDFGSVSEAGSVYARLLRTSPGGDLPGGIERISGERFWELGATFGTFSVDVAFDLTDVGGVDDMSKIRILHREDSTEVWTVIDPNDYTILGKVITVNGITDFSQFGIASTTGNTLPVELTLFTAKSVDGIVELTWETATEVNNYGFDVESSNNNTNWSVVGFVEGHGNSNSSKSYSFVANDGANYYRLKQLDTDGSFEYSDVVKVETNLSYKLSQNNPNPFNPATQISFTVPEASKISITVFNVLGQEVAELANREFSAGNHSVDFNASNLTSGIYFYRLHSANFSKTMKMMFVK